MASVVSVARVALAELVVSGGRAVGSLVGQLGEPA